MTDLSDKLEPEARDDMSSQGVAALVSLAISMKRIADRIAPTEGPALEDHIRDAISQGIAFGAEYAIGTWLRR